MATITVQKEFYTYVHTKPNSDIFYVGKGCGKRIKLNNMGGN